MAAQISSIPFLQHPLLGASVALCISDKLGALRGKKVVFSQEDKNMVPIEGWGISHLDSIQRPIVTLRARKQPMAVAAVDSSCIKVADSEDGYVCAVKCGVAISYAGSSLLHKRIGPFLFYINEHALSEAGIEDKLVRLLLADSERVERFVRIRTERSVQNELSKSLSRAIILVDGSLRPSQFEGRQNHLTEIVENCALAGNLLIGLSKSTKFRVLDRASSLLCSVPTAACMDVTSLVRALVKSSYGDNFMVTLGEERCPVLRADVASGGAEALSLLLGNDQVHGGYPESLRLAHHISTFSANEITCLRSYLVKRFGVVELASHDLRASLLGSMHV